MEAGITTTAAATTTALCRSILDKPLSQLTEEDISQLTREDCRKFLKEKGSFDFWGFHFVLFCFPLLPSLGLRIFLLYPESRETWRDWKNVIIKNWHVALQECGGRRGTNRRRSSKWFHSRRCWKATIIPAPELSGKSSFLHHRRQFLRKMRRRVLVHFSFYFFLLLHFFSGYYLIHSII